MAESANPKLNMAAVKDLIPYARNTRTHSDEQVNQIVSSIKEFGFTNPVLIDEQNMIIAGHGRVMAANKLKLKKIPTISLNYLTEAQKKAYIIADNRLALNAGWDEDMLKVELEELNDLEFDISLLGFEDKEIEEMLSAPVDGLTDEDAVPELPEEPTTKLGDLWLLDKHRLFCGDATNIDAVDKLMGGQLADMVFTDPPWNVDYGGNLANGKYKDRKIINDSLESESWKVFVDGFCKSFFIASKPGAMVYLVMSAQEWPTVDDQLRKTGFHWSSTIIWKKDTLVLSRKDYHTQYEPIWYGWNELSPRLKVLDDRKQSDVWTIERPKRSDLHPTTKPVELVERAISNSSNNNDNILDLFLGSGSTLIAAEKTNRKCYGMELDPKYCDVIIQRWEDFTGKKAELSDG